MYNFSVTSPEKPPGLQMPDAGIEPQTYHFRVRHPNYKSQTAGHLASRGSLRNCPSFLCVGLQLSRYTFRITWIHPFTSLFRNEFGTPDLQERVW
jgi:hypothetical protein